MWKKFNVVSNQKTESCMAVMDSFMASRRGFTLVEVIVAVAIFSFLMIMFASAVPLAERTSHMNGQYAQATSLCQHKIDQIRAVGYGRINYTELSDAEIIDGEPATLPFSFVEVDDVENYLPCSTATINVQTVASDEVKVTITITWRTAAHRAKTSTVVVSAIVTNVE